MVPLVRAGERANVLTDLPRDLWRKDAPVGRHRRPLSPIEYRADELLVGPLEGLEARCDRGARALASVAGGAHLAENLAGSLIG